MPVFTPIQTMTADGAVMCSACPRAAFFQARVELPTGGEHIRRRAASCATHLVDVIQLLSSWAWASRLASGWLTVAAIDPYAQPRLATLGAVDGFAFYSGPIASLGPDARHEEEEIRHG
jgi:hypothetical protein